MPGPWMALDLRLPLCRDFADGAGIAALPKDTRDRMPQSVPDSPEELIRAVAVQRDRAAFAALFRHFAPRIQAYMMKLGADRATAEELVQDAMLTVWARAQTFDPALSSAATWVFTIARNKRIDRLRHEARPAPDPQDPALAALPQATPEEDTQIAQSGQRLRAAMQTLSPEQSEVLRLSYFEERTQTEIAEQSGIPLGTVKTRMRLALGHLKKSMKESV